MTKKEFTNFSLLSIFAGASIGIATIAYLFSIIKLNSPIVGAVLFSFGLLIIYTMDFKIFTGVATLLPETQIRKFWALPISLIGNFIGVLVIAFMAHSSVLGSQILSTAKSITEAKLSYGIQSALFASILCGICISFSIVSAREMQKKGIHPALFIMFPVIIFVVCGFEHSIADFAFFAFAKASITWKSICFFLSIILGNLLGSPLLLLMKRLSDWARKEDNQRPNKTKLEQTE